MNDQFTDTQTLPNLRVITWLSQKGNKCELDIYPKQKEYSFRIRDKDTEAIIANLHYHLLLDAIIGLVNVIIIERAKNSKEDWWDKQNNFTERLFARLFGWK